ncbi:MAG: class I SAM-dependent methyltransferase [Anaerolineae bacterium]
MKSQPPYIKKRRETFHRQLTELPAFRALLRAVEADFYQELPISRPILDLGCGDGHFAQATFRSALDFGLDPWPHCLREARPREAHRWLVHAEGAQIPCASGSFGTVISNSVLEHIPDVDPVLAEVSRVLAPGGYFHFSVPGPNFRRFLSVARGLDAAGLQALAERYRRLFDRISRHHYYLGPEAWTRKLAQVGLQVDRWWSYFSPGALAALEWGHPLGLPSVLAKRIAGRWVLVPTRWNLWLTERLLRRFYEEPLIAEDPETAGEPSAVSGAYLFFSVQKLQ